MIHVRINTSCLCLQSPYGFVDWGKVATVIKELADLLPHYNPGDSLPALEMISLWAKASEKVEDGLVEVGHFFEHEHHYEHGKLAEVDISHNEDDFLVLKFNVASKPGLEAILNRPQELKEMSEILKNIAERAKLGAFVCYRTEPPSIPIQNSAGEVVGAICVPRADHLKYLQAEQQTSSFTSMPPGLQP
jgi:hypothetical protein